MSTNPDADAIWSVLTNHPSFAHADRKTLAFFRQALEWLLTLEPLLDQRLTVRSLLTAKRELAHLVLETDMLQQAVAMLPWSLRRLFRDTGDPIAYVRHVMSGVIDDLKRLLDADGPVLSEIALLHPKIGDLDRATWERHQECPLTLRELLLLQPTCFLGFPPPF